MKSSMDRFSVLAAVVLSSEVFSSADGVSTISESASSGVSALDETRRA